MNTNLAQPRDKKMTCKGQPGEVEFNQNLLRFKTHRRLLIYGFNKTEKKHHSMHSLVAWDEESQTATIAIENSPCQYSLSPDRF